MAAITPPPAARRPPSPSDPVLALERVDELLCTRADRARARARLGLLVILVGLLAAGLAFAVPGSVSGGPAARLVGAAPGLIGMAIGALVVAAAQSRFRRDDRLRRGGVLARGRVRSVERGPLGVGQAVAVEYRDGRGRLHQAASDALSGDEAGRWTDGAAGLLLYDPNSPADAVWLGIRPSGE